MALNVELPGSAAREKTSTPAIILIGYIFIILGRVHEAAPFLQPLHLGLILSVLALLVVLKTAANGVITLLDRDTVQTRYLLGMLAVACVSTLFSTVKGMSVTFLFTVLPLSVISYYFIISCCDSMHRLKVAAMSLIITLFIIVVLSDTYKGGDRWMSSTASYDPNDTALVLIIALPFIMFLIPRTSAIVRVFLLAMVPFFYYSIIRTGSRGGFIALAVVTILLLVRAKMETMGKIVCAVVVLALFGFWAASGSSGRIASLWSGEKDYNYTDTFGRKQVWERGMQLWAQHPVLGVGPGCYEMASGLKYAEDVGGFAWRGTAHNSYLLIGTELGFFGLLCYILFLGSAVRDMRRLQVAAPDPLGDDFWPAKALEVSIVGFMVGAFFLSHCYTPISYFLVGMAVAYKKICQQRLLRGTAP